MIIAKLTENLEDRLFVKQSMPLYGNSEALCMYGYWQDGKCIGGAYLEKEFPHNLVWEFSSNHFSLVKAIGETFAGFFKYQSQLVGKIHQFNDRALRLTRLLGCTKMYTDGDYIIVQFNSCNWRYKKRYPLE